jgi:cytochrome c biogenesis protein CcmG, thiol:disulfide interchange protein DsbE
VKPLKVAGQLGAVALVLALLGLLVWKVSADNGPDARVGQQVPRFDLPALSGGGRVAVEQHLGKPMVINFWATWCGPCREEAPLLEQAARKYRDRGVVFIGVDIRDFTGDAKKFVDKYDVSYAIAYDGPAKLWEKWGITGLPETFFVGRDGKIVEHRVGGYDNADDLDASIAKTLS